MNFVQFVYYSLGWGGMGVGDGGGRGSHIIGTSKPQGHVPSRSQEEGQHVALPNERWQSSPTAIVRASHVAPPTASYHMAKDATPHVTFHMTSPSEHVAGPLGRGAAASPSRVALNWSRVDDALYEPTSLVTR